MSNPTPATITITVLTNDGWAPPGASVRVPLRPGFAAELAATARDAALTSIVERLDVERAEVVRAQERLADASASVAALEAALTELDR